MERVLSAMLECPNEELAPIQTQVLSLDEPVNPDQESLAAKQAEEVERWRAEVGDCFSEGNFEYFMENYNGRTDFHALANLYSLTISIKNIAAEELQEPTQYFNVTLTVTNAEGESQECVTRWRATYDREEPDFIADIGLVDDGGIRDIVD